MGTCHRYNQYRQQVIKEYLQGKDKRIIRSFPTLQRIFVFQQSFRKKEIADKHGAEKQYKEDYGSPDNPFPQIGTA